MNRSKCLLLAILSIAVLVGQIPSVAAEPVRSPKKVRTKRSSEVTAEQEKAVLRFLRQHHTELAELIEHLKSGSLPDYQKAVRDLWRAQERLMQVKQRDGKRYELELEAWLVQSKIQLLVARLTMKEDDALREELRSLLGQRVDLRLRLLLGERDKQIERLRKIEEQVERLNAKRSEMVEKEFQSLTSSRKRLKQHRMGYSTKKGSVKVGN
jgi:hypothetical protein